MHSNVLAAVAASVLLGAAIASLPATLVGQDAGDDARGLRLGAEIGVAPDLRHRLDDDCADAAFFFGGRGSLPFLRVLALESSTRLHVEVPAGCATVVAPIPQIPGEGPYTHTRLEVEDRGYPMVSTDVRLAIEPFVLTPPVSVRAFAGAGGMWGKWIPYTLAGAGLRVEAGPIGIALEAERWWFEVTELRFEREFVDGEPVSEEELVASREIAQRMGLLRLAVELGL